MSDTSPVRDYTTAYIDSVDANNKLYGYYLVREALRKGVKGWYIVKKIYNCFTDDKAFKAFYEYHLHDCYALCEIQEYQHYFRCLVPPTHPRWESTPDEPKPYSEYRG